MNHDDPRDPRMIPPEGAEMLAAMRRGVTEALREHKRIGNPVVVWDREADRVVEVPPGEIPCVEADTPDERPASIAPTPS